MIFIYFSHDVFEIHIRTVGNLDGLSLRHDDTGNYPGLQLERLELIDLDTHEQYYFVMEVGRWIYHRFSYFPLNGSAIIAMNL